jgi:hypothetical protein
MATACHAQLLIGSLGVADAELEILFHDGVASPLGLVVHQWLSAGDRQAARAQEEQRKETICRFWPGAVGRILSAAELREEVALGMSGLIRSCRFSLGDCQFGLEYAFTQLTARKGMLRDFVFGRRFFLQEIPGLHGLATALRRAGGLSDRKR